MKIRIIVLGGLILMAGAVIAGVKIARLTSYQLQSDKLVPREKRLRWYVDQTKARGEREVILNAPFVDYGGSSMSTHVDDALSHFSAVLAQPIKSQVIAEDSGDILTWYKFKIVDMLSEKNVPACPECSVPVPPQELLPIQSNEFVMAKFGGTVTIDGVEVIMIDPTFPQLDLGKNYLLFISKDSSGVATIGIGPNGVFTVDDKGTVLPFNKSPHPVKDDMDKQFGKALGKFKEHARHFSDKL